MTAPDLGPLPEPSHAATMHCNKCGYFGAPSDTHMRPLPDGRECEYMGSVRGPYYTAAQMHAYALQERARMAEACAALAETSHPHDWAFIAAAIRAMAASTEGEK